VLNRPRSPQALALLGLAGAACAVTLAACGGGDEKTTGSTTAGGTTTSGATAPGSSNTGVEVPGGNRGIQEFGEEVAGSDLRQAEEAVAALFRAIKSGDWSEVCGRYLSRQNVEAFKKLAAVSPNVKGESCSAMLDRLNSTGEEPAAPENGVDAVRIEGDRGFALYRGTDGKGYAISTKKEDGRWKLNAIRPAPLEP
jgi:hypothetical protein